VHHLSKALNN